MTEEERTKAAAMRAIIKYGTPVSHVADCLFAGMAAGQHYIHTHDNVSLAFAKDRFENIMEHKTVVNAHSEETMMRLMMEAMAKAKAAAEQGDKEAPKSMVAKL